MEGSDQRTESRKSRSNVRSYDASTKVRMPEVDRLTNESVSELCDTLRQRVTATNLLAGERPSYLLGGGEKGQRRFRCFARRNVAMNYSLRPVGRWSSKRAIRRRLPLRHSVRS